MNESIQRLEQEVQESQSAVDSAILLVNGLANRLREALIADDDDSDIASQISELADQLDNNSSRLAAAVAANTLAENDSDEVDVESEDVDFDSLSIAGQTDEGGKASHTESSNEPVAGNADDTDGHRADDSAA